MEKKVAVSIAGSDPSAGAGIQADLKSFSSLGIHGATVITCVTSQNTQGVEGIYRVPADVVESQLESVLQDLPVAAVKTGMLYDREIVERVTGILRRYRLRPVVDPVMVATSGDRLSDDSFVSSLKQVLLPQSFMVTANADEAGVLAGIPVRTLQDAKDACKTVFSFGPQYVLVKGGHLKEEAAVDVVYDGKEFHVFSLPRVHGKKAHGSGCTLSALITGLCALGQGPVESVQQAKQIVWAMIQEGYAPGKGSDVLNHSATILVPPVLDGERFGVWAALAASVEQLLLMLPMGFIPEVGINFVYATSQAVLREDVCGITGRIIRQGEKATLCGSLGFGSSKHIAAVVLAAHAVDSSVCSALNIRYSRLLVDRCRTLGFTVGTFDRLQEPPDVSSTMEWGTTQAITELGRVPDVIYDTGGVGKEPMIRILGRNPNEVMMKLRRLIDSSFS